MRKLKETVCGCLCLVCGSMLGADIRVGIIGLDTSHAVEFTKAFNATNPAPEYAGFRVVAAYPKGSSDIASSTNRVPGYIEKVRALGVVIVPSIDELLATSDVVLLESNDGRPHLAQALPVFKSGKRVFIDKPVAGTLAQCIALYDAAARYKTPMFSASSLRYTARMSEIAAGKFGPVLGAETYGPCSLEATHPDFFWYGIHAVEMLFTVMGPECESVVRVSTPETDVAVGTWRDGRVGSFRGTRASKYAFGGDVFFAKSIQRVDDYKGYEMLLREIVTVFKTGVVPVRPEETIAIFAFMEAADESKRQGGVPVKIADVMARARAEAARMKAE